MSFHHCYAIGWFKDAFHRSVCHDEELYPEPGEFKPERHLDDEGKLDATVKDPRDLTFGFGRR